MLGVGEVAFPQGVVPKLVIQPQTINPAIISMQHQVNSLGYIYIFMHIYECVCMCTYAIKEKESRTLRALEELVCGKSWSREKEWKEIV